MRSRVAPSFLVLGGLVLAAIVLIFVELANGGAQSVSPAIAKPCEARAPFEGHGLDGTVQRVVLEGIDGAACKLHMTREELVLSLSPASHGSPRWTRRQMEVAIRSGLTHAVDAEAQQGNIPGLLVPLLHRIVKSTPFEKLIRGSVDLGSLIG